MVIRTEPDAFVEVTDLGRTVRFHFDERISEQVAGGTLEDAITVSPRSGEVRVSHGSRTLSVEVEGGLRPGVVYRVTLLPVVRDLFGNQLSDPFELVFSTGAEPTPTALAGQIWDRISGQGVQGALVSAVGPDSLVHVARADDQGIFALRYLPAGTFAVTGFEDVDRDGEPGVREVQGTLPATLAPGDTLLLDIPVLPPDTTAAVLARATALDSVTVVLEHDDYLDPAAAASQVVIEVNRDAGASPGMSRLFHEHEYAAHVREVTDSLAAAGGGGAPVAPAPGSDTLTLDLAAPDTAAPGTAPSDTVAVTPAPTPPGGAVRGVSPAPARSGPPQLPGVRGGGGRGEASGGQAGATPPGRVLPGRRLVALLDAPLEVGVEYQVRVNSVVNVNGLPEGGGEAALVLEAPPPPDTPAAADSVQAPDTVPDGARAPDTVPGNGPGAG